jgi:hypothetical protein
MATERTFGPWGGSGTGEVREKNARTVAVKAANVPDKRARAKGLAGRWR